jgi:hypothetical protein
MKYILYCILFVLSIGMARAVVALEPVPTVTKVEYTLPYPGILPDHPLYFMKRFRDVVLEMVIVEPVRKSEFYILQGDKRLQMGSMLVEQKKFALAESTVSKAEKYIEKAVTGLTTYKTSGGIIAPYVVEHAELAIAKHMEVLKELLAQAPEAQKSGIASSIELVTRLQQEAKALK